MNRNEHILTCLAEECTEVGQRVSKALRFGLDEIQPGQDLSNAERIVVELKDLVALAWFAQIEGLIPEFLPLECEIQRKIGKVEKFMDYARTTGALDILPDNI